MNSGHRGWKGHPDGRSYGWGTAPAIGVSLDSVGRMRGQPPIKPVPVGTVAERRP